MTTVARLSKYDAVEISEVTPAEAPIDLLLEADPSVDKINGYLSQSKCFVATIDAQTVGVYVLVKIAIDAFELMNISVAPAHQQNGIGKALLHHAISTVRDCGARRLEVGTAPGHYLAFYQRAGFRVSGIEKDFFVTHYAEPIYEDGVQLKDMTRLTMTIEQ